MLRSEGSFGMSILDEEVRSALADRGDNGQTPRHTLFFLYGGNIDGVTAVATEAGYEVRPSANRDGVVLETTIAVDEDSFEPYTQQMQAWADEFGCEYDGWECKVVNQ
jgi:Regulator of ribonuclease activity B